MDFLRHLRLGEEGAVASCSQGLLPAVPCLRGRGSRARCGKSVRSSVRSDQERARRPRFRGVCRRHDRDTMGIRWRGCDTTARIEGILMGIWYACPARGSGI